MIDFLVFILTIFAAELIVVLAYAISVGYLGFVNFGQVGLVGVGAYTAAILTTRGVSFWIAVPAAAVVTGIAGLLLALPTRKIKGEYYALMTLGFIFLVNAVIINGGALTRGPFGLIGIPRPAPFTDPFTFFALTVAALALIGMFVWRFVRSPFGMACEAIRDDEMVAEALGKPIYRIKLVALTVSAMLTGIGGAFIAHFLQFINANVFWLDKATWYLAALVIGGLASFRGTILGLIILYLIFEPMRLFLPLPPDVLGPLRNVLFALLVILVLIFQPKGMLGRAQLEE